MIRSPCDHLYHERVPLPSPLVSRTYIYRSTSENISKIEFGGLAGRRSVVSPRHSPPLSDSYIGYDAPATTRTHPPSPILRCPAYTMLRYTVPPTSPSWNYGLSFVPWSWRITVGVGNTIGETW